LTPRLLPALPYPCCFATIVRDRLFEPGVLESLLGRDALLGIVLEDAAEEIDELLVEGITCRDNLLWLGQRDVCDV